MHKHSLPARSAFFLLLALTFLPVQGGSLSGDVNLRIETFDEMERIFKALRFKVVNLRSEDPDEVMAYSEDLIQYAYRLPGLFEEISPREVFGQSRARPEIWEQKERYDDLMNEFIDNLEEINDLLDQGQMSAAGRQIDRTAKSCRRCHNTFRYR
ncbi:cytochrome c [Marinospirillum sp.]|uniref:cytochrome c n=1 Tax=Marinospirillum sp. TaxID=2183934 RepID=UPI00384F3D32